MAKLRAFTDGDPRASLPKTPTGIQGLDELIGGGLPTGRPSLVIAAPTLIKKLPLPLRRFIGDMSQTERILLGLDLRTAAAK